MPEGTEKKATLTSKFYIIVQSFPKDYYDDRKQYPLKN